MPDKAIHSSQDHQISANYADAVVADVEFVERIPFFIVRFLNNTDNDGAAVLCEFRGIAQQIQQNLVQAELVAEDNRNPPVL